MKQTVLLTALPIEIAGDVARVGVFVSPRLEPDAPATLQKFEDFLNWPTTLQKNLALSVELDGSGALPVTLAGDKPEEALWDSLFKASTAVKAFAVKPLHTRTIRSFPSTNIIAHVSDLHRAIAEKSPTGLPIYQPGKENGAIDELVKFIGEIGQLGAARLNGPFTTDTVKQKTDGMGAQLGKAIYGDKKVLDFNGAYAGGGDERAIDFALAYAFHDRPGRQVKKSEPAFAKMTTPELEFHEIVASLANYPAIMRRIGLVFQVEIPASKLAASGRLRIVAKWSPAPAYNVVPTQPWTRYEVKDGRFLAQGRPGGDIEMGMLKLDGAGDARGDLMKKERRFSLVQIDADGAAMKAVDFAINLRKLVVQNLDYTNPDSAGLPFVNSAGIGLIRHNRAFNVYQNLQLVAARNTTFTGGGATELYLDDILRGYRVDIQDSLGAWFSVMARDGFYHLTKPDAGYGGPNPLTLSDEGYVTGSSAASDLKGGPDLYLHESVARWNGWSLVAPRPGKTIVRKESPAPGEPAEVPEHRRNTAAGAHVHMEANFMATPKTLPRLRFGESYRVRVRTVDLGGFGPRLDNAPKDAKYLSNALKYARFEPVAQPFIVLRDKVREGESVERMVIRSNYDINATDYAAQAMSKFKADFVPQNERWLAPPKTSQLTAETHGMFDEMLKKGKVAEAYQLANKEEGTFLDVTIVDPSAPGTPIVVSGSKILNTPATPVYDGSPGSVKRKVLREGEITDPGKEEVWTRGAPLAPGQYVVHTEEKLLLPYLPDPFARGCAITGLRDVSGNGAIPGGAEKAELPPYNAYDVKHNVVKIPFDGKWPDRLPFRIVVRERPGKMEGDNCTETFDEASVPPVWDAGNRQLIVYLGKAETLRLRYSSYLDAADLELMGIYKWLEGSAQRNTFAKYGAAGLAWQMTPFRDLTLVHAVQQPLCAPTIAKYTSYKKLGATYATFDGQFLVNVPSTGRIEVRGVWTEWVDPLNEKGPKQIDGGGQAYFFDVQETAPNDLPVPGATGKPADEVRHDFNDTRYRKIDYHLIGTSRFREYFPPSVWTDQTNIIREGKAFTGVKVLNSARPAMPKILYIVPTFGWQRPEATPGSEIVSRRCGGGLRVYMDRPWYSSGDEELLGVVIPRSGNFKAAKGAPSGSGGNISDNSPLKPLVTQWGIDPAWSAYPTYSTVQKGHFKSYEADGSSLSLDEVVGAKVDVVGYTPGYDEIRRLWYCDIEVDTGPAYYPFIRLALARFQPNSVDGAHLSRVVLADFAQLAADRAASVVFESEGIVSIFVSGVYGMNEATLATNNILETMKYSRQVTASLEQAETYRGVDTEWRPVSSNEVTLTPAYEKEFKLKLLWQGRIKLPGAPRRGRPAETLSAGEKNYRVVVKEWEYFDADPGRAGSTQMENGRWMGRRLVYADAIEL